MQATLSSLWEQVSLHIPQVLAALGIFVGGWIVALIASRIVRAALRRTEIDNELARWITGTETKHDAVERVTAKLVFYIVMLFVLVAVFDTLGLTVVTEPLNALLTQVTAFAPRLVAGGALLAVAWLLATAAKKVVETGLGRTRWGQRVAESLAEEAPEGPSLASSLGEGAYWLVFLLFLPAVLGAFALDGLLAPVQELSGEVMSFLPNLLGAVLLFAAGWLVARLVQRIVSHLLAAAGLDGLADRLGVSQALGQTTLSGLVGLVVYVLILLPVLISALGALGLDSVTAPASSMLERILGALPGLFAAGLLMGLAYLVGRVLAGLVSNLLSGAGFDGMLERMGLTARSEEARPPSSIVGTLVLVAVLLIASIEAARATGFDQLAGLLSDFAIFGGQILMGLVIFGLGLFLANLAADAIRGSGHRQASLVATAARVAILVLASAMALGQMGLANEIINLAFGLLLGSVAVAAAIAFGVGSRDVAGRHVEAWVKKIDGAVE